MAHPEPILLRPLHALLAARGMLFPWVAVFLGVGVGLWFALPWEPGLPFYAGAAVGLALSVAVRLWGPELWHPPAVILGCVAAGLLAAGLRGHLQAAPVLGFRYYGPIQGRVIEIDRSGSDALRLTLDQVVLDRTSPARTPDRVRISLQGRQDWLVPEPGQIVILTGHLAAPGGPVEPGGFDFARMAFFNRLGAVGYSRSPVLLWADPAPGAERINRLRTRLSNAMMAAIPGDAGAFASGVMTGDRSGLSLAAVEALRDSSLAHLLAISGMNMAFLTGFVFALLRYGLALVPPVALRVNSKKIAAVVALGVALFYLLLSGANVATERAFLMAAVMLGAVLLDRRALTLRSVSLSAVILLLIQPESLLSPGFQMSFAATVALIAGFGAIEGRVLRERLPRWSLPVFTLVASSLIAGLATAPYAAAHFNRFSDYGILANLLTVPVMGAVVMPAGAVAALAAPFGLAGLPLWIMQLGCDWILFVAHWIAGLEGSVTAIVTPGPLVLPLITLGGIWLIVWAGRVRWAGLLPVVCALGLWALAERPPLLIAPDGTLAGLTGPEGRALSAPRGAGFAAQNWLEDDGDLTKPADAAARPGFTGPKTARRFELALPGGGALAAAVLTGKAAPGQAGVLCRTTDLVILAGRMPDAGPDAAPDGLGASCLLIDQSLLERTGALAVWPRGGGVILQPTRSAARLWSPEAPVPAASLIWAPPAVRTAEGQ